ncbi:hypothetical protein C723_3426 [Christiangramia flava JLT2011]|uniref:Uncharacterized protein n=1 Tax=Christiangramia flava JLT2011 TaxID=1229726 RepID=A0A1L7I3H3_9FLAO|nr:hypothetical protein GRFL_0908 [Christiangramia flava JLT2011]OSS37672.1 hypothetical protein C723_3426 [Christiangramia flava JLT2011]
MRRESIGTINEKGDSRVPPFSKQTILFSKTISVEVLITR